MALRHRHAPAVAASEPDGNLVVLSFCKKEREVKLFDYSPAPQECLRVWNQSAWDRIGDVYKAGGGWSVLPHAIWLAINNGVGE